MALFMFRLEKADGVPAEPPTLIAVSSWRAGDTIPLDHERRVRVATVATSPACTSRATARFSSSARGRRWPVRFAVTCMTTRTASPVRSIPLCQTP